MESGIYLDNNNGDVIVVFGGKIGIGYINNAIALTQLKETKNVGDKITKLDVIDNYPKVILHFENSKSIDEVIKALNHIKEFLNNK